MHDDPELASAVRVQGAALQVLAVIADLAADPLDVQRAAAMREALDAADEVRPLLARMRRQARAGERPRLCVVRESGEDTK